jgi:atypical dual specificity phosphatase
LGTGGLFLRKLRARVADEPTGFVWVEEGRLAGSGYPASRAQVQWLAKAGIGSILTLTENPLPPEWLDGLGVNSGHVPMKDHQVPGSESLERGVEFIERNVGEGRAVLVHCLAGEGRTGCVLAAYLVRSRKLSAAEALEALRKAKPEFVEQDQEKAVFDYAKNANQ